MSNQSPQFELGDLINMVSISLGTKGGIKENRIQQHKVIAVNDTLGVVDNSIFETISREKTRSRRSSYRELDHVHIRFYREPGTMQKIFGYCTINLYSKKPLKQMQTLIRKELKRAIAKEMAFYGSFDVKTIVIEGI